MAAGPTQSTSLHPCSIPSLYLVKSMCWFQLQLLVILLHIYPPCYNTTTIAYMPYHWTLFRLLFIFLCRRHCLQSPSSIFCHFDLSKYFSLCAWCKSNSMWVSKKKTSIKHHIPTTHRATYSPIFHCQKAMASFSSGVAAQALSWPEQSFQIASWMFCGSNTATQDKIIQGECIPVKRKLNTHSNGGKLTNGVCHFSNRCCHCCSRCCRSWAGIFLFWREVATPAILVCL